MLCFQQNKLSMSPWQTEKEGFEPSRRYQRPTPFPGEPLRPAWVLLQNVRYLIYTITGVLSSTFLHFFHFLPLSDIKHFRKPKKTDIETAA